MRTETPHTDPANPRGGVESRGAPRAPPAPGCVEPLGAGSTARGSPQRPAREPGDICRAAAGGALPGHGARNGRRCLEPPPPPGRPERRGEPSTAPHRLPLPSGHPLPLISGRAEPGRAGGCSPARRGGRAGRRAGRLGTARLGSGAPRPAAARGRDFCPSPGFTSGL